MNTKGDDVYWGVWIAKEGAMIIVLCRKGLPTCPQQRSHEWSCSLPVTAMSIISCWDVGHRDKKLKWKESNSLR